ncbi:MAG: hypothetical protein HY966_00975 [Ignavibacteriales bacterium]|nr:hypothetical protein [Ignavibacteriales bacterium]
MHRTFKYKLDFYYQQTLIYLMTLVLYAGIKGSFVENEFVFVFKDPIVGIIIFFFLIALVTLLLNLYRERRLVVEDHRIVFHSRKREREVRIDEIEWMHIGRERMVQTAGRFQQITIKLKGRRRPFRVRVGRYERDRELVAEMERLAQHVPKRKHRRFDFRRSTEQ